jgi:tetratricopeptide (TPR) repeat protein
MMKSAPFFLFFFLLLSCGSSTGSRLRYSTTSEKALAEFQKGWVQIMDEGRYGSAEESYRNALTFDPDFLVGKSVLARLTLNLEERLEIEKELFEKKEEIQGDERLIFDVYYALVRYTNLRDQRAPQAGEVLQKTIKMAEKNLRKLVYKYPYETYLKAEYIEFLHARYGAKQTIDSLTSLLAPEQKKNPFLLGVSASLHAELDEFDTALKQAVELEGIINDSTQPKPYAVYAYIYLQKKDLQLAKTNADQANELDPLNLDASRLKARIDALIYEEKVEAVTSEK